MKEHAPELFLFTRFIYYGSVRPGELIQLKIKDINLRTRTIHISANVSKTKTPRTVPIIKPFLDFILDSKILEQPINNFIFGNRLKSSTKPASVNYAALLHRRILTKLKIHQPTITTLYGWKHTGNINAYLAGMDIKTIQTLNGHKSMETTGIYLRKLGLFLDKKIFDFTY